MVNFFKDCDVLSFLLRLCCLSYLSYSIFSASQRKYMCCAYFLSSVDPVTLCCHPIKICLGHLRWNNNEDRVSFASNQLASKYPLCRQYLYGSFVMMKSRVGYLIAQKHVTSVKRKEGKSLHCVSQINI